MIIVCASLAGCSPYRTAVLPQADCTEIPTNKTIDLKVGHTARITLVSGLKETGEVMSITETTVTLGKPSNYGFQETAIPIETIETIKVDQSTTAETVIFGGLAGVAFTFMALLIIVGFNLQ
jgi:hypothetical protein